MKPTLKDIAERTGVNISTVSRVLNNTAKISTSVRAKILDAAQEFDYYPNHIAQSLMSKRFYNIGLVVPNLGFMFNGFFEEILRGIGLELKKRPYNLLVTKFHGQEKNSFFHNSRSGIIDGAIVLGDSLHSSDLKFIRSMKTPYVLLNRKFSSQQDNYVHANNTAGGFMATEHLINHGCKQLIYIGGPKEYAVTEEREKGFLKAVKNHQEEVTDVQIHYSFFTSGREKGYETMKSVVLKPELKPGIFTASDFIAYGVIQFLKEKGVVVGKDVAIVGYDNSPSNEIISPTLTSIDQEGCTMGEQACSLLIDRIENKESPKYYETNPKLVIRNSCGCIADTGEKQ